MKNLKIYLSMLLCLLAGLSVTSCLGDDDDDNRTTNQYRVLTQTERAMYHSAISGRYGGYLHYATPSNQEDSAAVNWEATAADSTVTVNEFPVSILADYVTKESVKELLKNAAPQTLKCQYALPVYELPGNITSGYYQYAFVPVDRKLEFDLDGKKMTINFADSYTSPYNGYSYQAMAVVYQTQFVGYLIVRNVEYDQATYVVERLMVLATPNV